MIDRPRLLVTVPGGAYAAPARSGRLPRASTSSSGTWPRPPRPTRHIDLVVPPYMGAADRLGALAGVSTRLVQSQSIGYDDVPDALPPGSRLRERGEPCTRRRPPSSPSPSCSLRNAASPTSCAPPPRGIGRPRGTRASPTAACCCSATVASAGPSRLGSPPSRSSSCGSRPARATTRPDASTPSTNCRQLLPTADIVIVGVPLTDATTGLVDDAFLSALPDGALVVNIARGKVADTDAILAEASSGRLRFALDVTDPEPLPEGHPLFALPNVLISPHVGGASTAMMPRMARLVRRADRADAARRRAAQRRAAQLTRLPRPSPSSDHPDLAATRLPPTRPHRPRGLHADLRPRLRLGTPPRGRRSAPERRAGHRHRRRRRRARRVRRGGRTAPPSTTTTRCSR